MNTVHLSLTMGDLLPSVLEEYADNGHPSFRACSSIKLPVPAAHTLFIMEKVTLPRFRVVNFESCPPISMMVSTLGSISQAALSM